MRSVEKWVRFKSLGPQRVDSVADGKQSPGCLVWVVIFFFAGILKVIKSVSFLSEFEVLRVPCFVCC